MTAGSMAAAAPQAGETGGRVNLHATAVVAGAAGILILGPSGAGKSSLALALIGLFRARGRFAALVADDRVWVAAAGGRLVAEVPELIAGLVEIRGFGPAPAAHERRAVLDRAVRLVPREAAPRVAVEDAVETVLGLALPRLDLAEGDAAGAARALAAWLAPRAASPGGRLF